MFVVVVFSNGISTRKTCWSFIEAEALYKVAVEQESNEIITLMNIFGNVYQQHSNL